MVSFDSPEWQRRLAEARKAREAALAARATQERGEVHDIPPVIAPERPEPESALPMPAEVARPASGNAVWGTALGLAAGLVCAALGLAGFLFLAPSPAPTEEAVTWSAPLDIGMPAAKLSALPAQVRLVVVSTGPDEKLFHLAGATASEIRLTPFEITETSVHVFNEEDFGAAKEIAGRLGAPVVDLRGIQPPRPVGVIAVYVSSE